MKRPHEVLSEFKAKVTGVVDIMIDRNGKGQFNGNGHFIVENLKAAR